MDEDSVQPQSVVNSEDLLTQINISTPQSELVNTQENPQTPSRKHYSKVIIDHFTDYEELRLPDGRILRRYDSGAVRVENPKSGIIQEERADGGLVISLPDGSVILQEYRGEPLLVYHSDQSLPPTLARVGSATLPQESSSRFVFHFQDQNGSHLVDLETLRYYKVRRPE